ncbi:MAG: DNA adenine methylase [Gemmataceae bacterium]
MTRTAITPPLKTHGGKHYLAMWLISLMLRHLHYVELFGGGLSVLLRKDPTGVSEVANDLNGDLINFFRVIQREESFAKFRRRVSAIPFSRTEWEDAERHLREQPNADEVDRAVWFFMFNRMSLAGRMDTFTGVTKSRTRGNMNAEVNAWLNTVEGLPEVHARLRRVLIENRPAIDLMRGHDVDGALMYADPPYPAETRTSPGVYGRYEMSDKDHLEFLAAAKALKHAKLMISGYPCPMYDTALKSWNRHTFGVANHASGGKQKERKVEVVWTNY